AKRSEMKRHKAFRAALAVSIEERRALHPDLTDDDVLKALHIVAGELQSRITRRRQMEQRARDTRWWDEFESRPRPTESEEARAQRLEKIAQRHEEARRRAEILAADAVRAEATMKARRALGAKIVKLG